MSNCKRCLDVWGVALKAPEITGFATWENDSRHALSINMEQLYEHNEPLTSGRGLISNITDPVIGQEIVIPDINDMADDEERVVYEPKIMAVKVPSSYPYRSDCATRRPLPPSSSLDPEACDPFSVELLPAYRIVVIRRRPDPNLPPYLAYKLNGLYKVTQSRAIRIDGKQERVTYVAKLGAGDIVNWWRFNLSSGPPPFTTPHDIIEPRPSEFTGTVYHGIHIQVGAQGGVLRRVSVARMENLGHEDWNVPWEQLAPHKRAFTIFLGNIPTVESQDSVVRDLVGPACNCVYLGKDYYLISGYNPDKSLTFASDWPVGRLNYDTLDAYGSEHVSNFDCDGDWKIVLPSCRAYLLTNPPAAKDLSAYGLTPPTQRLPDEPWVCAINSSSNKLVTGRALNDRLRTQGANIDEWDGTLDESEIENVVAWNTFPAELLAEAGLPSDYAITDIRVRSYQHINGKDYLIFSTPGPPRYVDFTAKLESDTPAIIDFNEETGFDRVRPPGVPSLNFGMPTGIEFISRSVGPGTHTWNIDQPLRFQQPAWPYVESDKVIYELCEMDSQGNVVGDECNLEQLAFLHNLWNSPVDPDTVATLKLYVSLGEGASISFPWRFDNRVWQQVQGSPGTYAMTNLPGIESWLEFRINGAVTTGDWTLNGTVYDDQPFHIDHADDSFTPETYETRSTFSKTGIEAGSYLLEWVVRTGEVHPLFGSFIGHAFIDSIKITNARLPDDADTMLRWYYDGDRVRELKHVAWAYRDQEQDPMPPEATRTKRVPDFITVEDPTDISGAPQKLLYCNAHYVARVNPDGSLDTTFHNSLDLRDQEQLAEEFGGVKKGFVRLTPSPGQTKIFQPCDDTEDNWSVVGDPIADPPWGAPQALTGKHKSIQLRGMNGSFRDASDVDLLPMRIDHTLEPFVTDESTVPPTRYETHGLASLPGWEGYRWLTMLRASGGWITRPTGWTIGKDGRELVPHLEIIWAPYFDLPAWPTKDWPSPPYPSAETWYWNRPRDPRRLPPWQAIEGNPDPNEQFVPIHFSQNNYIVSRSYTDALSHLPQFTWAKHHPDSSEPLGVAGFEPWHLVAAWQSPTSTHIGFPTGFWRTFYETLTWEDTNRCDPESTETRRTTTLRPYSGLGSIPGAAWTDFDAVDCECDCG